MSGGKTGGRPRITPDIRKRFATLLKDGWTIKAASVRVGISPATGYRYSRGLPAGKNAGDMVEEAQGFPDVKSFEELPPLGQELLKDFALFSEKVMCRHATPWRVKAAEQTVEAILDTTEKHYYIANEPPGVGKTTLWTCDIPAWLIAGGGTLDPALGRSLRAMLGHENKEEAADYVRRLELILADDQPYYDFEQQRSAEVCMGMMFGRFQPDLSLGDPAKVWSKTRFIVAQAEGRSVYEKEPTVVAASRDARFLGKRCNYIVWDDLVSPANAFKAEKVEADAAWMDTQAEPRLEPPRGLMGSAFWLVGQRIGPNDLFRDRLNQSYEDEHGEERKKYIHIVFPAHNESTCDGEHRQWDAEPTGEGCLLDEHRLPWREILKVRRQSIFRTVYQQEDSDPETILVPLVWLDGGVDIYNEEVPGCWDHDRGFYDWPEGIEGLIDYAAVDVAASGWWAIEHWANKGTEFPRYLIYGARRKMGANDLLDWSHSRGRFTGLMEEMQQRSHDAGHPIRVWVIEANACQRHLMQYDHFHRWKARWEVEVLPHQTQKNKVDPKLGVRALLPGLYREGMKRLPRKRGDLDVLSYTEHKKHELTTYPDSLTTDTVMADWEGEYQLQLGNIMSYSRPRVAQEPDLDLPGYLLAQRIDLPYERRT